MRDALPHLQSLGLAVLGISPDSPPKQKDFDERLQLGLPLLCDEDHSICKAYGAWGEKKINGKTSTGVLRSSFLIDETGHVAEAWYNISPQNTVPELLKAMNRQT